MATLFGTTSVRRTKFWDQDLNPDYHATYILLLTKLNQIFVRSFFHSFIHLRNKNCHDSIKKLQNQCNSYSVCEKAFHQRR